MTDDLTVRPTSAPTPKILGQTRTIGGIQFTFAPATLPQLDRYFSKVRTQTISASVRLVLDMAGQEQEASLAPLLEQQPGLALNIANKELEAKGFGEEQD